MRKRRGRGEGAIYCGADNGIWCSYISLGYDAQGKRRRRYVYGKTKLEVLNKLAKLHVANVEGTLREPHRIRLAEYLSHWLEDVVRIRVRASTFTRYKSIIKVHVDPYLGGVPILSIQPSHLQFLFRTLEDKGASARTREFTHVLLKSAFNQAVKWGYVARNVCDAVDKPRVPKKAMQCWNEHEVQRFLRQAKDTRYYPLYVLAIMTGLRQGELLGLKWEDISLNQATLSIQRTVHENNGKFNVGEPKTSSSRRRVDLPRIAVKALRQHRERMLAEGYPNEWVFRNERGNLIRRSDLRKHSFRKLIEQAGLPMIRFHDLRHTAATLLLSQGVHPKIVQERLGHAQISITLDTYSHVLPSMQKEAVSKLDILFG